MQERYYCYYRLKCDGPNDLFVEYTEKSRNLDTNFQRKPTRRISWCEEEGKCKIIPQK